MWVRNCISGKSNSFNPQRLRLAAQIRTEGKQARRAFQQCHGEAGGSGPRRQLRE
jgi:hypothetical protein